VKRAVLCLTLAFGACAPERAIDAPVGDNVPDEGPFGPPVAPPVVPPPTLEACAATATTTDAAGDLLRREESELNEWGDRVQTEIDADGDGVVDERWSRVFDDAGRLIRVRRDTDADGADDETEEFDFENGLLVEHRLDTDADGFADRRTLYAYAEDGQLTMLSVDEDGDFDTDFEERREYDDLGRLEARTLDVDGDGLIDEREVWQRDEHGLLTAFRDLGDDGRHEWILRRRALPPARVEEESFDPEGDEVVDETVLRSFDGEDRTRLERVERDGALVERRLFTWGAHGLTRVALERPGSPAGERLLGYDEAGRRNSERLDADGDGVPELEQSLVFGDQGPLQEVTVQRDLAGEITLRRTLVTGEDGTVLRSETPERRELSHRAPGEDEPWLLLIDEDADGVYDRRTLTVVECG
jgi:hypothetical protein